MSRNQALRHFSTATKVYPPYLPYLQVSTRVGRRWVAPALLLATAGIGITVFRQARQERALALAEAARKEIEDMRRRQEILADAYAGRSNLHDLEDAIHVYEGSR